jgi:hypothetical protein
VKLETLTLGSRFRLPDCGKTGVLLSSGPCGARVIYDGARRQVEITVRQGDEVVDEVSFEAPGKPVIISNETVVEVLDGEAVSAR